MTRGEATSHVGFLTVLEHDTLGLVGGYLILNAAGRPLEFHCTAPVKPNRAQQILFGPTLEGYLYGEQIGQALLAKGSLAPLAVCTNVERALAVRDFVSLPVALVLGSDDPQPSGPGGPAAVPFEQSDWRIDAAGCPSGHLAQFSLGRNRLAVAATRHSDRDAICQRLESLAELDLSEPFGRIHEAVDEAHKVSRA